MFPSLIQLICVGVKVISCIAVMSLFLSPTTIYRTPISMKNFNFTFGSIEFGARYFFCDLPQVDNTTEPTAEAMLEALNLPKETNITDKLSLFGECLVNMASVHASDNPCYCKKQGAYVALIVTASISLVVEISRYGLWFQQWRTGKPDNKFGADILVQFYSGLVWCLITVWAAIYHASLWRDYFVYLPNSFRLQFYYQRPLKWSVAIDCSALVCVCCFFEYCYLLKRQRDAVWKSVDEYEMLVDGNAIAEEQNVIVSSSQENVNRGSTQKLGKNSFEHSSL